MVKLLRVDERLLHGQVALNWVRHIGTSLILIANDEVADNEMSKMALKLAKPNDVKLSIRDIAGAVEMLNDPRSNDMVIFVIVRTIEDALKLVQMIGKVPIVNVGGVKKKAGAKFIAPAVFINDDDIKNLRELEKLVDTVEFRMLPADSPKSVDNISKDGK